jgi:carboxyl-terminal processing protease
MMMTTQRVLLLLFSFTCLMGLEGRGGVHQETVEAVWTLVHETHWDLASTGVDWNTVHDTFTKRAADLKTTADTRALIMEMVGLLGHSHFGFLEGSAHERLEALLRKAGPSAGEPGFRVIEREGQLLVERHLLGVPAPEIPVGAEVLQVNGLEANTILKVLADTFAQAPQQRLYHLRYLQAFFSCGHGGKLTVTWKGPAATGTHTSTLTLHPFTGEFQSLGNLPPMPFDFFATELSHQDKTFAYIRFSSWLFPLTQRFPDALNRLRYTHGLIVDLRDNGGGVGFLASTLAGYLCKTPGKLGSLKSVDSTLNFPVIPRPDVFNAHVVILVNEASASTSEIFAAGLRDLGRARVMGSPSAGAALPSFIRELPNGDLFQYAFASYHSVNGDELEKNGVTLDEELVLNPSTLAQGEDVTLQAALTWLVSQ